MSFPKLNNKNMFFLKFIIYAKLNNVINDIFSGIQLNHKKDNKKLKHSL